MQVISARTTKNQMILSFFCVNLVNSHWSFNYGIPIQHTYMIKLYSFGFTIHFEISITTPLSTPTHTFYFYSICLSFDAKRWHVFIYATNFAQWCFKKAESSHQLNQVSRITFWCVRWVPPELFHFETDDANFSPTPSRVPTLKYNYCDMVPTQITAEVPSI